MNHQRGIFTEEGARRLVNIPVNAEKMARMEQLAEKANEGLLTSGERGEYEALVYASKIMSILRLKAGAFLANIKAA